MPKDPLPDAGREPSEIDAGGGRERRRAERRPTMLLASVVTPDGAVRPCVVRDMSTTGARLSVSSRHALGARFRLVIQGKDRKRVFHVCLAWQKQGEVGVMISPPR